MSSQLLIASRSTYFEYLSRTEGRLLAMVFVSLSLRNFLLENWNYLFLIWNLLLAYAPILIQQLSLKQNIIHGKWRVAALACWIIFLPNAPYILTDLIHPFNAAMRGQGVGLPLGILSVSSAAILGMLWYLRSLRHFDHELDQFGVGLNLRRVAVAIIILATSCGVWIGRILRFNSWDIITKPLTVLIESAQFLATSMYIEWVLTTALFLWASWRAYGRWSWVGDVVE